jgi:predicted nuclease with TOPRIM domain
VDVQVRITELDARQRTSEHRIKDLEGEMHDLRKLTEAVAVTNSNVEQMAHRVDELHQDVKDLKNIPAGRWEKAVTAVITGVAGMLAGGVLALVLQ